MPDLTAIQSRLDAARFATHTHSHHDEREKAWSELYEHAPDDLDALVVALTAAHETIASLRRERSRAASTIEEIRAALEVTRGELENLHLTYKALYTSACKTRVQLAETRELLSEVKTERDRLRAELDARDLADLPMGGEAS